MPTRSNRSRTRLESVLTNAGYDLLPVLAALSDWGQRHLAPGTVPEVAYRHGGCGGPAYQVMSMPALALFVDGGVVARLVGARPRPAIVAELEPHLRRRGRAGP